MIREDKFLERNQDLHLGDMSFYRLFVRELQLDWRGLSGPEALSLSVNASIDLPNDLTADRYKFVVCYDRIVTGAKSFAQSDDFTALEDLAGRIAEFCLEDPRVREVTVDLTPVREETLGQGGHQVSRRRAEIGTAPTASLSLVAGN